MNQINVAYILDKKFYYPTIVSLQSLCIHANENAHYDVYLICVDLSDNETDYFDRLSKPNVAIHIINVSSSDVNETIKDKQLKAVAHVSTAAIYKFSLPNMVDCDKLLYIDGDTIIKTDLLDIFNIELSSHYVAASLDPQSKNARPSNSKWVRNGPYFNTGVLLMNTKLMRTNNLPDKLLDYRINGINDYMDQDAFNAVINYDFVIMPTYYNFSTVLFKSRDLLDFESTCNLPHEQLLSDHVKKASILHFTGPWKPWNYYNVHGSFIWYKIYRSLHLPTLRRKSLRKVDSKYLLLNYRSEKRLWNTMRSKNAG